MEHKDPFEFLMTIGSSPEGLFLVGAPFLTLVVIVAVYAVVVAIRRRKEKAALEKEMELTLPDKLTGSDKAEGTSEGLEEWTLPQGDKEKVASQAPLPEPLPLAVAPRQEPAKTPEPSAPAEPDDVAEIRRTDKVSWLGRLKGGLAKTRDSFKTNMGTIFSQRTKLNEEMLEQLHEALYRADIGVKTADKLVDHVRKTLGSAEATDWSSVATALKEEAKSLLAKPQTPLAQAPSGPWVILVVGVNGVGKTTTIGKLAAHYLAHDKKVLLCAADTFRAAAIDQLQVWGDRLGVDVIKHKAGSDPAAVAYDGVKAAVARSVDVLLIDTAGRLHSKNELMDELGKINRTIGKDLPGAPHETWLVIDSTTGQNAAMQVKAFKEVVKLTGLVVTKLDGTAKGGVLIGIADEYQIPIRYIGVGEKAVDLRDFEAGEYADSLF